MDHTKSDIPKRHPVDKYGRPLQSVESYQEYWNQILEDTNAQLQKIHDDEIRRNEIRRAREIIEQERQLALEQAARREQEAKKIKQDPSDHQSAP
ncbi:hypothetical protein N7466_007256 [Penicillium verhagenii]|uniref:uncharacterized protein n=1 Tax=Penicillium verhagenii TaxID=1562060 RepID=UPI0025453537|nr:uncharacterized protein N7466_007256 [Penicillium verhagenii]KAJ5928300.1 hypothetical protein N7466_007256 [Penicillium verhagenii]